jgi:phosphonate transport system substrate-binding protein
MKTQLRLPNMFLLCFLMLLGSLVKAETLNSSFGTVPQQSTSKLALLSGPILKNISDETGFKVNFKTAPDLPTFEKRLAAGEYDFADINPYHYAVFNQTNGYQVLAKACDKLIRGVLVVRKDNMIEQIVNLDGITLAFPLPAAFVSSILSQSKLNVSSVQFKPKYVSSYDSVYRRVAKGLYPAGVGVVSPPNYVAAEIRDQLRVLWTSRGYTRYAIAAHLRISKKKAHSLQQALVKLDLQSEGAALLKDIEINGFEIAQDSHWDEVCNPELKELSYI